MDATPRDAVQALFAIERARGASKRHSLDNGTLLLVWGTTFLLDLLGFDVGSLVALLVGPGAASAAGTAVVSHPLHVSAPLALVIGMAWMFALNSGVLGWRVWHARRLPIRLRQTLANRVIFWWSWYYVALLAGGIGAWAVFVGAYPAGWFTLLGLLGAAPLWLAGLCQRRRWCLADVGAEGMRA